jgi:hypothetical protein
VISWSSRKQELVTLSTAEVEFVVATHAAKEALWLQKLLGNIYPRPKPPTPKRSTPGCVLDDFSLADTFIAQPPPHRLHLIKHAHGGHSTTAGGSCEYARVCCECTIAISSYFPPPGAAPASPPIYASPPTLLARDLPLSPPTAQPAHRMTDCALQNPIHIWKNPHAKLCIK